MLFRSLDSLDSTDVPAAPASSTSATSADGMPARDRTASSTSGTTVGAPGDNQDEQSVLDFLDEITQSASTPTVESRATPPNSQGKSSVYDSSAALPSRYLQQQQPQQQQQQQVDSRSSWLGSLWSTASEAVKTTQTAVQSSVKATMESQATKNLEERVKGFVNAENIGKIGKILTHTVFSACLVNGIHYLTTSTVCSCSLPFFHFCWYRSRFEVVDP